MAKNTSNTKKNDNKLTVLLVIGLIVVIAFVALYFLNNQSNKDKLADNPYKKDSLKQSTIDLLDDKNYQNIILPEDLEKKIASGKDVMVYFFKSDCIHCKKTSPILMPLAKDMGVHIDQYNLTEFEQGWDQYQIDEGTPTIVYYKDGKEQLRVVGEQSKDTFKKFFEASILKDKDK